jgi:predicted O-methyltransferase YrrM
MADTSSRAGERHVPREVLDWMNRTHVTHDSALQAAFDTPERAGIPAIQVGMSEGKLISMLCALAGAKKVVEVGTLAGYSTIHLARALPADGHVWSVEFKDEHAKLARENLERAGLSPRATVHVGRGVDVLPTLEAHGPFVDVFIDAEKESYDLYGRWAARNVRRGGLLLGDNAFFFGRLLEDSPGANAMRRFHEEARQHFDTVNVPTPDGLLLGVKK